MLPVKDVGSFWFDANMYVASNTQFYRHGPRSVIKAEVHFIFFDFTPSIVHRLCLIASGYTHSTNAATTSAIGETLPDRIDLLT